MRACFTTLGIAATTTLILALAMAPANAIDNQEVAASVTAGGLSATVSGAVLSSVSLGPQSAQVASGISASLWQLTDARGSGAAWTLSASGTDFVSAAGTEDLTPRTLPIGNLVITPGVVTASAGADNAPLTSPVTMTGAAQALVTTSGNLKGTFTLRPTFDLTVPANAFRSNFALGTTGTVNPYIATITFTIA
ncbi:MAG: hypothetical protein H7146_13900 [Burkholderiaceae bacterium]|nr:hypothetical protein [Microbacteriaceae bacterium]